VTHAQVNFPQYHDAIIKYGPEKCIDTLLSTVETIDKLLDLPEPVPTLVKGLFGLEGLKDHADFGEVISGPLGYWQAKNWDPAGESSSGFDCADCCSQLNKQSAPKGSTTSVMPSLLEERTVRSV